MKNTKKLILLFSLSFLFCTLGLSQNEKIKLKNPCFEDVPRPSYTPRGWFNCGGLIFPLETPPDVHPSDIDSVSFFGVTQKAYHGDTYLGLVVRENDSFESISQELDTSLKVGSCYYFSIYLCKSDTYKSSIRDSDKEVDFTSPIKLRILGGGGYCDTGEFLAETGLIDHTEWKKYSFTFSPKREIKYIVLEAFYQTPTIEIPNGNILLDNASSIVLIDCEKEQ